MRTSWLVGDLCRLAALSRKGLITLELDQNRETFTGYSDVLRINAYACVLDTDTVQVICRFLAPAPVYGCASWPRSQNESQIPRLWDARS